MPPFARGNDFERWGRKSSMWSSCSTRRLTGTRLYQGAGGVLPCEMMPSRGLHLFEGHETGATSSSQLQGQHLRDVLGSRRPVPGWRSGTPQSTCSAAPPDPAGWQGAAPAAMPQHIAAPPPAHHVPKHMRCWKTGGIFCRARPQPVMHSICALVCTLN